MRRLLPFLALSAALLATAAYAAPTGCSVGLHPAKTAEIYFGRGDGGAIPPPILRPSRLKPSWWC